MTIYKKAPARPARKSALRADYVQHGHEALKNRISFMQFAHAMQKLLENRTKILIRYDRWTDLASQLVHAPGQAFTFN